MKILVGISTDKDAAAIKEFLPIVPQDSQVTAAAVLHGHGLLDKIPSQIRVLAHWRHSLDKIERAQDSSAEELIDRFASSVGEVFPTVDMRVEQGDPFKQLISIAKKENSDLIVVARQQGEVNAAMGHIASRLVRYAPCSVLLLDPRHPVPRVCMLSTDGSAKALIAGARLNGILANGKFKVVVCSVAPSLHLDVMRTGTIGEERYDHLKKMVESHHRETSQKIINSESRRFRRPDIQVKGMIRTGDEVPTILHMIKDQKADLLVVGTQGLSAHGGFLLGSVTLELLRKTTCSVLVGR